MEIPVCDMAGVSVRALEVPEQVFARPYQEALIHQVVVAWFANRRLGTRAQLSRGEVARSGKKPWRQKGTGHARAGSKTSPLWRGGGHTFPNKPWENFSHKVNKKMYKGAMASILAELSRRQRLIVVDDFSLESHKTKALVDKLKGLGLDEALLVLEAPQENLLLAARNLPHVEVRDERTIDPVALVDYEKTLVTAGALENILRRLS